MVVETHGEKVRENRVEQYGLNLFAIALEKDRHSARLQSGSGKRVYGRKRANHHETKSTSGTAWSKVSVAGTSASVLADISTS